MLYFNGIRFKRAVKAGNLRLSATYVSPVADSNSGANGAPTNGAVAVGACFAGTGSFLHVTTSIAPHSLRGARGHCELILIAVFPEVSEYKGKRKHFSRIRSDGHNRG